MLDLALNVLGEQSKRTVAGSASGTALSLKVLDMVPVRRASWVWSSAILKDILGVAAAEFL